MVPSQSELPLFECAKDDANVLAFVTLLERHRGWLTAAQVIETLALPDGESRKRDVRAWAESASELVISGQHGYRHTDHATPEEIHHFCYWMESQGSKMKLRAARTRARAHRKVG